MDTGWISVVYLVVLYSISMASAKCSSVVSHHSAKLTESGLYWFFIE